MDIRRKVAIRTAIASVVVAGLTVTAVAGTRDDGRPGGEGNGAPSVTPAPASAAGFAASSVSSGVAPHLFGSFLTPKAVVRTVMPVQTPPLRTLVLGRIGAEPPVIEIFEPQLPAPPTEHPALNSPRQSQAPAQAMPSPANTFEGIRNEDNRTIFKFRVRPPDPEGDIGPNHYVEWINLLMAIYDRNGTRLWGPYPGNAIFSILARSGGVCGESNNGDPLVLYDHFADRWVISQFGFRFLPNGVPTGPYFQCTAVSRTPDPLGTWCLYPFQTSATHFNDYGKIGMWPATSNNAYFFSLATFAGATAYAGPGVLAVEREKMIAPDLAGNCQAARQVYFDPTNHPDLNPDVGPLLPSDLDGTTLPPAGSPNYLVSATDDFNVGIDRLDMWKFTVDWSTPVATGVLLRNATSISNVPPWARRCVNTRQCIPQKDTTNRLDHIDNRLMYRLAYRNFGTHESLVTNHTVDATGTATSNDGVAGVRWYEIRDPNGNPPNAHQVSTWAPADGEERWMGSAAMDELGNLAIGYSASSANSFPSIRYAGRLVTDTPNELSQGEAIMQPGGGSQLGSATSTADANARWGDYTSLKVDPVDDCTFWYINEYYSASSDANWQTRIGSFRFPQCTGPTAVRVKAFAARWRAGTVQVSWRTVSEVNALGFNVYRSTGAGPFRKVNRALIPARSGGRGKGASYRIVDRRVRPSVTYTYRLQTVSKSGKLRWYGIGSAAVR